MRSDCGTARGLKNASARDAAARLLDLALAAAILVLLAPVMALVSLAIAAEGGRPIFFSQVRLGLHGQPFRMHKFRKFHDGKHQVAGGSLTMEDDPRLTRTGGLLARTKLDELPQLWNILRGEMAIVGPRPESLAFGDCFDGPYRAVLDFKPGIFGPSQVQFRNEGRLYRGRPDPEQFYREIVFPLKAQLDLAYFPRRTLLGDVAWMVRGALAVVGCSSACRQAASLVEHEDGRAEKSVAGGRELQVERGLPKGVPGRAQRPSALDPAPQRPPLWDLALRSSGAGAPPSRGG